MGNDLKYQGGIYYLTQLPQPFFISSRFSFGMDNAIHMNIRVFNLVKNDVREYV